MATIPIVDTHLHLVHPDRFGYRWWSDAPALQRPFTLDDYLHRSAGKGIAAAIHMEADVAEPDIEGETAFVTSLGPPVVGAIAACRPETVGFEAFLDRMSRNERIFGFRRVLHVERSDLVYDDLFVPNVRRLAAGGYTFDLCVFPDQLGAALHLARSCPDVQFILDHCGVPDVRNAALDPWRADLAALAAHDNVACKISGIIAYGDGRNWTLDGLRPFFEHAIACFGWDRVVWGSDWPVSTTAADVDEWIDVTRMLLSGCSESEQRRLLNGNARQIYRRAKLEEM